MSRTQNTVVIHGKPRSKTVVVSGPQIKNGTQGSAAKASGPRGGVIAGTPEAAAEMARRHGHVAQRATAVQRKRPPSGGVVAGTPEAAQNLEEAAYPIPEPAPQPAPEPEVQHDPIPEEGELPDSIDLAEAANNAWNYASAVVDYCDASGLPWPEDLTRMASDLAQRMVLGHHLGAQDPPPPAGG